MLEFLWPSPQIVRPPPSLISNEQSPNFTRKVYFHSNVYSKWYNHRFPNVLQPIVLSKAHKFYRRIRQRGFQIGTPFKDTKNEPMV